MNRIINGKRYNTETAQRIDGAPTSDGLKYEVLFRTRSGRFFLFTTEKTGAGFITPYTLKCALAWARENMTPKEIEAAFGPDASPSALFVQVGPEIMAGLRAGASAEGLSVKAFVERILRDALDNPNQK